MGDDRADDRPGADDRFLSELEGLWETTPGPADREAARAAWTRFLAAETARLRREAIARRAAGEPFDFCRALGLEIAVEPGETRESLARRIGAAIARKRKEAIAARRRRESAP